MGCCSVDINEDVRPYYEEENENSFANDSNRKRLIIKVRQKEEHIKLVEQNEQFELKNQHLCNSYENKSYYKKQEIYKILNLKEQLNKGYESDQEKINEELENNKEKDKGKNIITINIEEENKNKEVNEKKIIKKDDNNKISIEKKEGNKGKKKVSKQFYENKIKELEEKEKQLKKEIEILEKKNEKKKENLKETENKKLEIKNNLESFDTEKKKKELELSNKERLLKKKEEELKKIYELYHPKFKPILIGLNNIGATCYMNASLQCLSNTNELTEYFLKNYKEKDRNSQKIAHEYYKLIKNLWDEKSTNKSYSPNSFKDVLGKENPLFSGIAANDSKDFINFLIERLHQELNVSKNISTDDLWNQVNQANENDVFKAFLLEFEANFNSPISKYFYGITETKSQCKGCNVIKFNFQVYSFLEFPLQQVNKYYFENGKRPLLTREGKNPDVDLYECFEYNRKIDLMAGDNQMYCSICNRNCDSFYSSNIYSGPNYLILNLNRGRGAAYECNVIFPEILNLFNFLTYKQGITVYELYGVICHLGPSSMSGHFVAYCRNRIDNQWYLYNDGIVSFCTKERQYTIGMPYILFYRALRSDD